MLRVTKPGGFLVLADWRYGKPGNPNYRALSTERIRRLFAVGSETAIVKQYTGALVPPLGRFLSKRAPWSYFLVKAIIPWAAGQVTTVLQRL
jgi:hypothetical protein